MAQVFVNAKKENDSKLRIQNCITKFVSFSGIKIFINICKCSIYKYYKMNYRYQKMICKYKK